MPAPVQYDDLDGGAPPPTRPLVSPRRLLAALKSKHPQALATIDGALAEHGLNDDSAGYLPLDADKADPPDWVVIVERATGLPRAFLPLDGW